MNTEVPGSSIKVFATKADLIPRLERSSGSPDAFQTSEDISVLLPGLDDDELEHSLVYSVSHHMMLDVYVLCTPAAELVGGHYYIPGVVFVHGDFDIHGNHHERLHLPREMQPVHDSDKREVLRLR